MQPTNSVKGGFFLVLNLQCLLRTALRQASTTGQRSTVIVSLSTPFDDNKKRKNEKNEKRYLLLLLLLACCLELKLSGYI